MLPTGDQDEVQLPGFRTVEFLGRGDRGAVWAIESASRNRLAMKVIPVPPGRSVLYWKAFSTACGLRHPNLLRNHGVYLQSPDGRTFPLADVVDRLPETLAHWRLLLASDLAEQSLADAWPAWRDADPAVAAQRLLSFMAQAATGLECLHSQQVELEDGSSPLVHGAVKPANLLIIDDVVRLAGFFQPLFLADLNASGRLKRVNPAYQAPEVLAEGRFLPQGDVYALAISYAELRMGRLPFTETSFAAVAEAQLKHRLDFSPLPIAEQGVLHQATAIDPEERFGGAVEFVRELYEAVQGNAASISTISRGSPGGDFHHLARSIPALKRYDLVKPVRAYGVDASWLLRGAPPASPEEAPLAAPAATGAEAPAGGAGLKPVGSGSRPPNASMPTPSTLMRAGNLFRLTFNDLSKHRGSLDVHALQRLKRPGKPSRCALHDFWILNDQWRIVPADRWNDADRSAARYVVLLEDGFARTLADEMERLAYEERLPDLETVLTWLDDLAEALDDLNEPHEVPGLGVQGIQHRQIHPESLFLSAQGRLVVGHFAFARAFKGTQTTIPSGVRGLVHPFLAPEIFTGMASRWGDQYSLAMLYHELRTGFLPFDEESLDALAFCKQLRESQLNFRRLAAAEAYVVARATALVPEDRFPNAHAFVAALRQAVVASGAETTTPRTAAATEFDSRRTPGRSTWESVRPLFHRDAFSSTGDSGVH